MTERACAELVEVDDADAKSNADFHGFLIKLL